MEPLTEGAGLCAPAALHAIRGHGLAYGDTCTDPERAERGDQGNQQTNGDAGEYDPGGDLEWRQVKPGLLGDKRGYLRTEKQPHPQAQRRTNQGRYPDREQVAARDLK